MASIIKVDQIQTAAGGTPTAADLGLNTTGAVLQVVHNDYSTETSSSSTSFADTGLNASITPSNASSKVLVNLIHTGNYVGSSTSERLDMRLYRKIGAGSYVELVNFEEELGTGGQFGPAGATGVIWLDSPNTTSEVTYKTMFAQQLGNSTIYVNTSGSHSTISLMEIAG